MISKLIWSDAPAQHQPQMNVDNPAGAQELEQLVAQVSEVKNGEYAPMPSVFIAYHNLCFGNTLDDVSLDSGKALTAQTLLRFTE